MRTMALAILLGLGGAACGSDAPVDMAGTYAVNLTNRDNGCALANWQNGNSSTGIPMTITQEGAMANATVEGAAGAYVELLLGSRTFVSDVDGAHLEGVLIGTRSATQGACTYQITATLRAGLVTDTLTGTIAYTATTNHHADCGTLETCASTQDFNGLRPPP